MPENTITASRKLEEMYRGQDHVSREHANLSRIATNPLIAHAIPGGAEGGGGKGRERGEGEEWGGGTLDFVCLPACVSCAALIRPETETPHE